MHSTKKQTIRRTFAFAKSGLIHRNRRTTPSGNCGPILMVLSRFISLVQKQGKVVMQRLAQRITFFIYDSDSAMLREMCRSVNCYKKRMGKAAHGTVHH